MHFDKYYLSPQFPIVSDYSKCMREAYSSIYAPLPTLI